MESLPKVTIITITFNAEKVLEKTILSVLNQTYKNIEYIIVDGGSKDGTVDIIKKYQGHIRWISEPDKGLYDAMNKGIKMASGEWINCMNADDIFASNDVLEKIFVNEFSPNIKFLYSDNWYEDEKGRRTFACHDHTKLSILHQSCIYKRELHQEHGYYVVTPQIIVSDVLFFGAIPQEEFQKVDVPISINRIGGVSSSAWCIEQSLCAKVVFRKMNFTTMLLRYIFANLKRKFPILKKII